jgi:hypothetical protein
MRHKTVKQLSHCVISRNKLFLYGVLIKMFAVYSLVWIFFYNHRCLVKTENTMDKSYHVTQYTYVKFDIIFLNRKKLQEKVNPDEIL